MKLNNLHSFFKPFFRFILALGGMAMLAACGSSGSGGPSVSGYNLAVKMTDASGCDYHNIVVTIDKVALNNRLDASKDDHDWTTVTLNPPVTIDLLQLQNGNTLHFADLNLPAGTYKSILLSVVPNIPGSSSYNDYVTLIGSPNQQLPLLSPPGFPNRVAINFNKAITISANGTALNVVIDFDACNSIVTSTDNLGNIVYILKPRLTEVNEDASGGITGTVTTSSDNATTPEHLVVKAEMKGKDGNYYVVRQTRPNPDGSFKLYPLEFDDDSKGVYDVVVVSDNYGTVAIRDVAVPSHEEIPASATTYATVGTIKLDTLFSNTWSTTGTFTGTIQPRGANIRIRETVGGRTYQVRRHHADLQTGLFTFPLSWGATSYVKFTTGSMIFTADSVTPAGSYTADIPSRDNDNDDRTPFQDVSFSFRVTDGMNATTVTHNFMLLPSDEFGVIIPSASVSGTIKVSSLPLNAASEEVLILAMINGKMVNGTEVVVNVANTSVPYTINYLPAGASVILSVIPEQYGLKTITPSNPPPILLSAVSNIGPDFTISP